MTSQDAFVSFGVAWWLSSRIREGGKKPNRISPRDPGGMMRLPEPGTPAPDTRPVPSRSLPPSISRLTGSQSDSPNIAPTLLDGIFEPPPLFGPSFVFPERMKCLLLALLSFNDTSPRFRYSLGHVRGIRVPKGSKFYGLLGSSMLLVLDPTLHDYIHVIILSFYFHTSIIHYLFPPVTSSIFMIFCTSSHLRGLRWVILYQSAYLPLMSCVFSLICYGLIEMV